MSGQASRDINEKLRAELSQLDEETKALKKHKDTLLADQQKLRNECERLTSRLEHL